MSDPPQIRQSGLISLSLYIDMHVIEQRVCYPLHFVPLFFAFSRRLFCTVAVDCYDYSHIVAHPSALGNGVKCCSCYGCDVVVSC